MVSKYLAILLFIPIIYAKIQVNVVASENEAETGEPGWKNVDIITDNERYTFQLTDNNLKNAVQSYFGQRPDDAFLRSPTPWGDLYQVYGWPQVARSLSSSESKYLQVSSKPSIILTQHFRNNSTQPATFKAQIQQQVQNTVTSTWEKGGELTVGQEIEYGFDIKVVSVGGKTSFSYTSRWGESVSKSETVTVGSESGVEITLEPGQAIIAELLATRGTMEIQVDYEATLSGATAVNYANTFKGHHHFWASGHQCCDDVWRLEPHRSLPGSYQARLLLQLSRCDQRC
uniref:Follicle-specific yolk polypeptide-4 n=1 Tax=Galleria mellonella TaxID=7137 RepID=Q24993_GALME|nr:follicle-specific yolk polypeptide-4 [Galleria mellonella]